MASLHPEQSKPLLVDGEIRRSEDSLDYVNQQTTSDRRRRILLRLAALVHPAHLTTLCKRFGYACTPQLIRSHYWDEQAPLPKQFPTSYLNGLRGITAIKVFTFHYMMAFTDFTYQPWGTDERHDRFLLLPVVRYFYSGFTSQVFFGIAGYLTSLRLFQLLDKVDVNSQAKFMSSVAGSLFRRGFRLYLPVFIITFIMSTYIYFGLYENNRQHINNNELFPGPWNETKPPRFDTFREQTHYWAMEMYHLTDITTPATIYPEYDQHLWSMLSEMRASLHLYTCIIAVATCKRYIRLIALFGLTYLFFTWNSWETWVYILGAIVAQIDIILTERAHEKEKPRLPTDETEKFDEKQSQIGQIPPMVLNTSNTLGLISKSTGTFLRFSAFVVAFHLLSFPIAGAYVPAPGYEILKSFIPDWMDRKDKFYPNIGTGTLLLLLARSDPQTSKWRRLLMSPIPQYLGGISFALYLVHGPLLHAFGYMIPHRIWWASGRQGSEVGDVAWVSPIILGWTVSFIVSLAVADVWTREIEGRCVRLVKRIETICFMSK